MSKIPPEVAVPDGEDVAMAELVGHLILQHHIVEFGRVGAAQGGQVDLGTLDGQFCSENPKEIQKKSDLPVEDGDPELGVLLADDGQLDPDVAALSAAQHALLHRRPVNTCKKANTRCN
jgi:hypothetical protein